VQPFLARLRSFLRELRRRRVFRTAGLYIVGAWLVMQAADVFFPAWGLPDAGINVLLVAALLGFPLALVFGWLYQITPQGIVRTRPLDEQGREAPVALQKRDYLILMALGVIAAVIIVDATRSVLETPKTAGADRMGAGAAQSEAKLPRSVAVLPFVNASDDPDTEYFCDGISEEILLRLGSVSGLNVIGRISSFKFKNSDYSLRRITDLLGTRYVVQGTVRKEADRLRISAELVDETGTQLWSKRFDRTMGGVFAIQTEIAEEVASMVAPRIGGVPAATYEPSFEAYQHFLAGRELLRRRQSEHGVREQLEKAIELDPDYAAPYAELAVTYLFGTVSPENIALANRAIDTAVRLEPGMPRALAVRALALQQQNDPDWAVSEIVLREVLETSPNMVDALNWLASALNAQEKFEQAAAVMARAAKLDPLHGAIAVNVAMRSARRGDIEAAEQHLLRLLGMPQPSRGAFIILRDLYWSSGRLEDMNAVAKQTALQFGGPFFGLALNYALLGLWEQSAYWAERSTAFAEQNFWASFYPSFVPWWQGRYRESLEEQDRVLAAEGKILSDMADGFVLTYGDAQALAGEYAGAIDTLEPLIGPPRPDRLSELSWYERDALHSLALSYLQTGLREKAMNLLQDLDRQLEESRRRGVLHDSQELAFFARNALLMGDAVRAVARFEQAVDAGWCDVYVQRHDPRWAGLEEDAQYQALMARVKAHVDRQRAEIERLDAAEDFPALMDGDE